MYNPVGVRQLNAFAARAVLRLPDARVLDPRTCQATVQPPHPQADSNAPPAPIEP
jgi:hypothetical protein